MVEIMKVLYRGARTLILDEPTAVLTPQEIDRLFAILRRMKKDGCAIIIITHKLNEVMEISDRVSILRKGRSMGTVVTSESQIRDLIERMVGESIDLSIHRPEPQRGGNVLDVHRLSVLNADKVAVLSDVSFAIARGNPGRGRGVRQRAAGVVRDDRGLDGAQPRRDPGGWGGYRRAQRARHHQNGRTYELHSRGSLWHGSFALHEHCG